MANTLNLGNGDWATKENSLLGYNSENGNYKPLPFDFTRASNGTFVNKSGLIETAANGVPRIDFLGNTKGALLLEPQRTNVLPYSQDFSHSSWLKNDVSIQSGYLAPDGTNNAYKVTSTGTNPHLVNVATGGNTGAKSIYAKTTSGTGTVILFNNVTTYFTITEEWQRFEIEQDGLDFFYAVDFRGASTLTEIIIWGAQSEAGSYATSLINTQGSAVTRVQDVCKIVDSPILQATNQFTLFFDAKDFVNYGATFANIMITLGAGESPYDAGSGIHIYNKIWYYFNGSSAVTLGNCYNATTDSKFAISYDGTKYTRYANGVKLGTNTVSASMSNWDTLTNGSLSYSGVDRIFNIADLKLYNTALSDSEAIALTQV